MIPRGHSFGVGMTKKRTGSKRPRAGALPHRRDNTVDQTHMFRESKERNFFRRFLGMTNGDIRSFQLCITNSGYYTVYLKDLPATDERRPL